MSKVPLTARGAEKLRAELEQLKRIERPKIIEAIAEARAHGDLKENAEYHAARERQSFCEGRIKDIEGKLSHAQIIDVTMVAANGKVVFGATVDVLELDQETEHTFQIVGEDEADSKTRHDLHQLAHRPRPDRQGRGRCRLGPGTRGPA